MMDSSLLTKLEKEMQDCTDCDLCEGRSQIVFAKGQQHKPKIMMIGEAPGLDEDMAGIPFVGMAGRKLDRIMKYVGITEKDVYITNSVLCRPPHNRNPKDIELQACRERLLEQIRITQPEIIITLGKIAAHQLWGKPINPPLKSLFSSNINDRHFEIDDLKIPTVCTYHPSYLLRAGHKAYLE